MNTGYMHPVLAESSLPISIPTCHCREMLQYQILSNMGQILQQGWFKGSIIYISTRMLPKGQRFLLRIVSNDKVLHEGRFETMVD